MSTETLGLDPEVSELLLDIARDKDSTLLRVPRAKLLRYTATGMEAGKTGLSSAERHLMQTHRIEVARALRDLCRARLWEHPQARFHVMRPVTRTTFFEVPAQAKSVRKGLQAAEALRGTSEAAGVTELLEACIQPTDSGPSITQLAAASLRLEPTDQARIYSALECKYEERDDEALLLLGTVLNSRTSVELRASALTNFGNVESARKQWVGALDAYASAASLATESAMPLMSAMLMSLLVPDIRRGRALAERINDEYGEDHPATEAFAEVLRVQCRALHAGWTRPRSSSVSQLMAQSHGATERILNELYT